MAASIDASSSENTTNKPNFSLVKLFMKQKSHSNELIMADTISSSENWPSASQSGESNSEKDSIKTQDQNVQEMNQLNQQDSMNRSIQTSQFSEVNYLKHLYQPPKPVKVLEPSFLNKLKKEGEVQKPVYVLYPNYVLPNLDFVKEDLPKVLLLPQEPPLLKTAKKRPFSCNDLESLKRKGFSHIKDWDSLNFLLPLEYKRILSDVPEISQHIRPSCTNKPSFAQKRRPLSCDLSNQVSSTSSSTTPSSGYRGSSTILSDSQNSPVSTNLNPLFVYRYDSVTSSEASLTERANKSITTAPPLPVRCVSLTNEQIPPRPPLPKSILRKDRRFSLYETSEEDLSEETKDILNKHKENLRTRKRMSETEDEGVDAGTSSSMEEHLETIRMNSPNQKADFLLSHVSTEELAQLEEFLKISGISTSTDQEDLTEENLMQLRSYVGKFLALKINQDNAEHFGGRKSVSFAERVNVLPKFFETKHFPPNNSPNVSAFLQHRPFNGKTLLDTPICEESETNSPQTTPKKSQGLVTKEGLVNAVGEAVERVVDYFSLANNQMELNRMGDSSVHPQCAKLALSALCPALYAVLSDGLKPSLESSFGAITNSVWQVS